MTDVSLIPCLHPPRIPSLPSSSFLTTICGAISCKSTKLSWMIGDQVVAAWCSEHLNVLKYPAAHGNVPRASGWMDVSLYLAIHARTSGVRWSCLHSWSHGWRSQGQVSWSHIAQSLGRWQRPMWIFILLWWFWWLRVVECCRWCYFFSIIRCPAAGFTRASVRTVFSHDSAPY